MAKFEVTALQNIQRTVRLEVNVLRDEVVEEMSLEGEERKEWREHVQEYLESNTDKLDDATVLGEDEDGEQPTEWEVQEVSDL